MKIEFRRATAQDIESMRGRFRKEDDLECHRTNGRDAYEGAMFGLKNSEACLVGIRNGAPFVVFGCSTIGETVLGAIGCPWLLATDDMLDLDKDERREFMQISAEFLKRYLSYYDRLENYVDAHNSVSIQYLKKLGFKFGDAEPFGVNGEMFYKFYINKEF